MGIVDTGTSTSTSVDCEKQVRSWNLLRSLMHLLIPTCNCNCSTTIDHDDDGDDVVDKDDNNNYIIIIPDHKRYYYPSSSPSASASPLMKSSTSSITATIFRYRRGKVRLYIQTHTNSNTTVIVKPILLLELAVPTTILANEMRSAARLRIVLETSNSSSSNALFSTPLWTMYCNGRKVGYAVKRKPSKTDLRALSLMRSVVEGTGVMKNKDEEKEFIINNNDDEVMYLRANFRRVRGSKDSESFHLIDPDQVGGIDPELSIFFFRSS